MVSIFANRSLEMGNSSIIYLSFWVLKTNKITQTDCMTRWKKKLFSQKLRTNLEVEWKTFFLYISRFQLTHYAQYLIISKNKCFTHGSNFTCVTSNRCFFVPFFIELTHIERKTFQWNGLDSNEYDEKL